MRGGLDLTVGLPAWLVASGAALLGWLLATVLLTVGVRPLGWVALGVAVATIVAAMLCAGLRDMHAAEVAGLTFACMMLSWPVLGFITLLVLSWAGVATWE